MKHLFIINPTAGKGKNAAAVQRRIEEAMSERGEPFEIYITAAPMDACAKVKKEAEKGEKLRIYACGGDGTLNECVNGAAGFENAAVTHYACGSGNDFVRMFGNDAPLFSDINALVDGEIFPLDIIDACGRKAVNVFSLGFDARVGTTVHEYTGCPLISGSLGYVVSLIVNVVRGINSPLRMKINGEELDGEFALVCACNGRFYGGGFNPVPDAEPDDGYIDVLVVNKVSRLRFMSLVGKYAKGRYAEMGSLITRYRCTEASFESPETIPVNLDGECVFSKTPYFRIVPGGVNFIAPAASKFAGSRMAKTEACV